MHASIIVCKTTEIKIKNNNIESVWIHAETVPNNESVSRFLRSILAQQQFLSLRALTRSALIAACGETNIISRSFSINYDVQSK